ncbi:hypothetical protein [Pseudomonas sp. 6D_7.1_Bac1]|uniref:hypothetical protein n=1 Tax=Pseudomonas sp. 6D_7.1_Bac1 TaxID=2971615 RepID=UPI0021C5D125|nr:hypothetical protein [Pseudomonas sp. 6D_7.1_Bac1]MCU1752790.1 hypothetical protein [Pseudomonas sp. 6D_7.1_Bac1]
MPASAIRDEMRPEGTLRPVIGELAAASGSYIIVSAQGSVADKPLADRRKAIREQLHDLVDAQKLHTDFYDRDRLATWVNEYPGIVAWVRLRVGLRLAGWSSIGNWVGTTVDEPSTYLFDDKACLTDERSREGLQLTIGEGIAKLRETLRTPGQCIRLVGLSGLGKTRLVQALFESQVGSEPLDPSLAVYTDYSVETDPTARDMARQLIMRGHRAVLVVDNCNPATHSELARICSDSTSNVSLLTIEYDVGDDEPERTEVFRLQSASTELVSQWLKHSFPNVSQVDRSTIADFSDGNFRVARAIADTLGKGETLGKLKSRDLFERIFQQRNEPDQGLLLVAEDLSLLYSVDGEDSSSNGELANIGNIRSISAHAMYAALIRLGRRGIAQSRGRWRAILPHAIANSLATSALERIPPEEFDRFCASLTPRMQKSLSRRLGFLHDSAEPQATVARWLRVDGPLGDLFSLGKDGLQIITNIAPVAPEAVLARIERELNSSNGELILAPNSSDRWQWIRLIKKLGYDPQMFERAAMLLARFVGIEPEGNKSNSARDAFAELFHLYLSGTQALPAQRCDVVRRLATSIDPEQRRCASITLDALLSTGHFTSSSNFDFGARPRDWGWCPKVNRDVGDWYNAAIALVVDLSQGIDEAPKILARRVRELWAIDACHEALECAAAAFAKKKPWIEGWLGFRAALRFEGKAMPADVRAKLETIIQRLKPSDLLHQARAVVLNGSNSGWDIVDGDPDDDVMRPWHKASQMAQEVGRLLAQDSETRKQFIVELLPGPNQQRAFECGLGLAEGAVDLLAMWHELVAEFALIDPKKRNATVLGGFIYQAHRRDITFTSSVLEAAIDDRDLGSSLPYLQARVGIDKDGIERLQRAIGKDVLLAADFYSIANGVVVDSPSEELSALLFDIAKLSDGVEIALDILHMHFYRDRENGQLWNQSLIEAGRDLLRRADFSQKGQLRDFGMQTVVCICCSGSEGEETARDICIHLCDAIESFHLSPHDVSYVLKGLFKTQTFIALDVFLLHGVTPGTAAFFEVHFSFDTPVEDIDSVVLRQWADMDATLRYPLLGQAIPMFARKHGEESDDLNPTLLELLVYAPDKHAFLGSYWTRLQPRSWMGPLADILVRRRSKMLMFRDTPHAEVRRWIDELLPDLDLWIEKERKRDREQEESFE